MAYTSISILLSFYLVPTFVALLRHHHNVSGVFVVNLLTGWTVIGWIAALIMACMPKPTPAVIVQQPLPPLFDTTTGKRLGP
jgi:hypothetical protein